MDKFEITPMMHLLTTTHVISMIFTGEKKNHFLNATQWIHKLNGLFFFFKKREIDHVKKCVCNKIREQIYGKSLCK